MGPRPTCPCPWPVAPSTCASVVPGSSADRGWPMTGAHHLSAMCLRSTLLPSEARWGGYFNGDPQDDFHGPDGPLLPDTETLHSAGRTWSPQVSRSITGPIPMYPHNRVSWGQSLAFCGLLWADSPQLALPGLRRASSGPNPACPQPLCPWGLKGDPVCRAGELRPAVAAAWPPPAAVKTPGRRW